MFDTADGKLALAANFEPQYQRLCTAIGREDMLDDPRFADHATRLTQATLCALNSRRRSGQVSRRRGRHY